MLILPLVYLGRSLTDVTRYQTFLGPRHARHVLGVEDSGPQGLVGGVLACFVNATPSYGSWDQFVEGAVPHTLKNEIKVLKSSVLDQDNSV